MKLSRRTIIILTILAIIIFLILGYLYYITNFQEGITQQKLNIINSLVADTSLNNVNRVNALSQLNITDLSYSNIIMDQALSDNTKMSSLQDTAVKSAVQLSLANNAAQTTAKTTGSTTTTSTTTPAKTTGSTTTTTPATVTAKK